MRRRTSSRSTARRCARYTLRPEEVGIAWRPTGESDRRSSRGGDSGAERRRSRARSSRARRRPRADLALINAGAAIYAAGVAATIAEGVEAARETVADGARGAGARALRAGEPRARAARARTSSAAVRAADERGGEDQAGVLERILASTRAEVRAAQARGPAAQLTARARAAASRARASGAFARRCAVPGSR